MKYAVLMILLFVTNHASAAERPAKSHVLLIVTANQQENANRAVVKVFGPMARDTFAVPYYMGVGKPVTPTHYVACWAMDDATLAKVEQALQAIKGTKPSILKRTDKATPDTREFRGRPVEELQRRGAKPVKPNAPK